MSLKRYLSHYLTGVKSLKAVLANLTPVTLELGGKSPVIVTEQADLDIAAHAIVFGKMTNAGQICTSPDYVLVHHNVADVLQAKIAEVYRTYFKSGCRSKDVSAIINQQQFSRLKRLLSNAEESGATITSVFTNDVVEEEHKLGLHIVTDTSDAMLVMQEEIFGPILPILPYDSVEEVFESIEVRPEPLALYIFTNSKAEVTTLSERIQSGGLSVNECILHVAAEHAPFGGVGRSGLGQYHDKDGFETFSHKRTKLESYGLKWRTKLMLKKPSWFIKPINWLFMK
jgi:coniferyl-aldehyde dehydrogenase